MKKWITRKIRSLVGIRLVRQDIQGLNARIDYLEGYVIQATTKASNDVESVFVLVAALERLFDELSAERDNLLTKIRSVENQ
jgi:hypothetical protein